MLDLTPKHDYLIGIDSDGCVFDTMELKHKECFIPNTINHWNLQGVSKYFREAWEFVNLYSTSRGGNRFPCLIETLQWLGKRPEVKRRGVTIEIPPSLVEWVKRETKLANPALEREVERAHDPALTKTLVWSKAVNEAIGGMVRGVPPFPFVRESLEKAFDRADVLVVSATPQEALEREWEEHDIARYVVAIWGQEHGTKKEHLAVAKKYAAGHVLMVGDALGDYKAAQANAALFFPINPGAEEASWQRFHQEGIERFFAGTFAGKYQEQLLTEFHRYLPERPPWKVEG
jgi:phosphoglycolate phosphatase-like HAD superfamily hydrolase